MSSIQMVDLRLVFELLGKEMVKKQDGRQSTWPEAGGRGGGGRGQGSSSFLTNLLILFCHIHTQANTHV